MKETVAQEEKEEEEVGIYTPFPFPLKNVAVSWRKICTILIMRKTWEKIQIKWAFDALQQKYLRKYGNKNCQIR